MDCQIHSRICLAIYQEKDGLVELFTEDGTSLKAEMNGCEIQIASDLVNAFAVERLKSLNTFSSSKPSDLKAIYLKKSETLGLLGPHAGEMDDQSSFDNEWQEKVNQIRQALIKFSHFFSSEEIKKPDNLPDEALTENLNILKRKRSERSQAQHEVKTLLVKLETGIENIQEDIITTTRDLAHNINSNNVQKHSSTFALLTAKTNSLNYLKNQSEALEAQYQKLSEKTLEIEKHEESFRKEIYACKKRRLTEKTETEIQQIQKNKEQILDNFSQNCHKISEEAELKQQSIVAKQQRQVFLSILQQKKHLDTDEWKSTVFKEIYLETLEKIFQVSDKIEISLLQKFAELSAGSESEAEVNNLLNMQKEILTLF